MNVGSGSADMLVMDLYESSCIEDWLGLGLHRFNISAVCLGIELQGGIPW